MGDHDTLFKRAFSVPQHAAGLIRTMLPAAVVARMDVNALELLPASFVDAEMAERHADLLFRAPIDGRPAYVYILIEHQSAPDALMPFRGMTYIQRIWASVLRNEPERRTLPIVVPVIIHHGRTGWTGPRTLHEMVDGLEDVPELAPLVPNLELLIDDLVEADDAALLSRPLDPFPKVALWVLRDARTVEALFESLRAWGKELERLVAVDRDPQDIQAILRYILRVAGDTSFETVRQRFIEVTPAIEAAMASPAEQLIQQGLEQGLQKGRQEGLEQGNRKTLARLLRLRFGALGSEAEARIEEASGQDVERWLDRVVTAGSLEAVFAD